MKKQFVTFLFIGGINTLFGYTLFAGFLYVGMHYAFAVLFATVIGIIFNFFTVGRFVFENKSYKLVFKFIIVYVIVYFINIIGLWAFDKFSFDLYISGAILIFPLAMLSFLLNKFWVFRSKRENV